MLQWFCILWSYFDIVSEIVEAACLYPVSNGHVPVMAALLVAFLHPSGS